VTAAEVMAALEAAGARLLVEAGRLRLLPGGAPLDLLVAARAQARELAAELRSRRLADVLASSRRCSAASQGLEGDRATLAAGRTWCAVADGYVRGVVDASSLATAEVGVIAAWRSLPIRAACCQCGRRDREVLAQVATVGLPCERCWRGEVAL